MGQNSKIEWTDHTFNPWIGCSKVSAGCDNCYAKADFADRKRRVKWGPQGTRVVTSEEYWKKPLKWNAIAKLAADMYAAALRSPKHRKQIEDGLLTYAGRPRVFCASLADVLEDWKGNMLRAPLDEETREPGVLWYRRDIGICRPGQTTMGHLRGERLATMQDVRMRLLRLIADTPALDWLLLTKRPENFAMACDIQVPREGDLPSNMWMGTSVENRAALKRIELLREIPAAVRFLSCEPLLEDLGAIDLSGINWVIIGGESGQHARPMHPDWARGLRDQCQAAGVRFFFKQWGEWCPGLQSGDFVEAMNGKQYRKPRHPDDATTGDITHLKLGKKVAGRLLDGREWNELPASAFVERPASLTLVQSRDDGTEVEGL